MNLVSITQLQFNIKLGDVQKNMENSFKLIEESCNKKATDYICMPEMWSTGFISKKNTEELIDSTPYILNKLKKYAQRFNTNIICGSLPNFYKKKLYNTSFVIDRKGNIAGASSKKKLFPNSIEPQIYSASSKNEIINTDKANIGILICFDLRFSQLFTELTNQKAQIIFIPSQFLSKNLEHWHTLLKARAIENQLYIAASNSIGKTGKADLFGNSVIYGPKGDSKNNMLEKNGYSITTIDLDEINIYREKINCGNPIF